MCCDDSQLYCVEWRRFGGSFKVWLTVYDIGGDDGRIELMDTAEVGGGLWLTCHPRVDSVTRRVYVPRDKDGVMIFRYENRRLVPDTGLRCVPEAGNLAVHSKDTLYVCDWNSGYVCLVNVSIDTVTGQLQKPPQADRPEHVSVLPKTTLVCYGDNTLMTYRNGRSTPEQVLQLPEGLARVSGITTHRRSSFLVTSQDSVFLLDDKLLWHSIHTGGDTLCECCVVKSHLWLGDGNGYIAVLTSQ